MAVLQDWEKASSSGQGAPWCCAGVTIVRVTALVPPPHVLLQFPNVQSDTLQLTGQGCLPHGCSWCKAGHSAPPPDAGVTIVRWEVWTPWLPHVSEQLVHSDHPETRQLTTQTGPTQARLSVRAGHALPPKSTLTVTCRVRVCTPMAPQLAEHAPQAPHEETWQFTGHAAVLQGRLL